MSTDVHSKLPPHSIESEQAVLGGLLLRNECWEDIGELITTPDAFYLAEHKLIWKAIVHLNAQGMPFDIVTVAEQFTEQERKIIDLNYLAELANATPSVANIHAYARIVRDRYQLRILTLIGKELSIEAMSTDNEAETLIESTEKQLSKLASNPGKTYIPLIDTLSRTIDHIDESFNEGTGITGTSTGYADLNELTAGLQTADLIITAGRPSMGKTTFGLNLIENVLTADSNATAFVFSLEMPREQLVMRLLASIGKVPLQKIRTGKLDDEDWPKLTVAASKIQAFNDRLIIEDEAGLSASAIRARSRRFARKFGEPAIILVDYLQLIQEPRKDNRNLEIASISLALKHLAKELRCPVVALSQLNRSVEQRHNKRPINSDLRDSGALEQDADVIMFVYRDEVYFPESPDKGTAEIIIGKQRNGPLGTVRLAFNGSCSRFESLDTRYEHPFMEAS